MHVYQLFQEFDGGIESCPRDDLGFGTRQRQIDGGVIFRCWRFRGIEREGSQERWKQDELIETMGPKNA